MDEKDVKEKLELVDSKLHRLEEEIDHLKKEKKEIDVVINLRENEKAGLEHERERLLRWTRKKKRGYECPLCNGKGKAWHVVNRNDDDQRSYLDKCPLCEGRKVIGSTKLVDFNKNESKWYWKLDMGYD